MGVYPRCNRRVAHVHPRADQEDRERGPPTAEPGGTGGHGCDREATPYRLAALMVEGVATRPPLTDVNERLAWLAATVLLDLNDVHLDAPEVAAFGAGMAVIRGETAVDTLAAFFEDHAIGMREGD